MERNQVTHRSSHSSRSAKIVRSLSSMAIMTLILQGAESAQVPSCSEHKCGTPLPRMPEVSSPATLRAVNDSVTGAASFSFAGNEVPPVLHTSPGHVLRVDYVNAMSTHSTEMCVDGPCSNMTNLHFHGLHVSPASPQDDVISMMAAPGQSLHYEVQIPADQPPGLYWYHTHPHGESYRQALDGMSGALIVDGIERYAPEVLSMPQQILVLRDVVLRKADRVSTDGVSWVEASNIGCGLQAKSFERLLTVNGVLRPAIAIRPGERQFWRVVNASPDLYADLQLSGETMEIIALDGMPLAFHNPGRRAEIRTHILLAPGGRVEAIVRGPHSGAHATLKSRCVSTGADGDPNPAMVLADVTDAPESANASPLVAAPGPPVYRLVAPSRLAALERSTSEFAVTFTEDKQGFYINGHKYAPDDKPMVTVAVGDYHHWSVVNRTREVHPFHIHQVHFLVYAQDGAPLRSAEWFDTVNVAPGGQVDIVMDFTDPIIRGLSVFHCHLLQHEDKGMMAKILFVDSAPGK